MEFIDLKTQYRDLQAEIDERVHAVMQHGRFIMGPEIGELEEQLAAYVDVRHCIAAASGTDALLLAMMALGVGPGDEVITTPFTFIATGEMISLLGAIPVFVDIDERTYNIDPARIEPAITPATRAIMPVSLYGQCADMAAINAIADRHGLPVIEDGAQSFGATTDGRRSCGLSTIGCTSFFPSKPLGCYGDGGACFTNDDDLAQAMRELRVHGQERRYHHTRIGINGRLDTLQAAILLAKLPHYDEDVAARSAIGQRYGEMIKAAGAAVTTPYLAPGNTSVYAQYSLQTAARETVLERLGAAEIPTAVHYPVPLHRQPVYSNGLRSRVAGSLEIAEAVSERIFSVPMHPYLDESAQEKIVSVLCQPA